MKCIVLAVACFAVALEAKPYGLGLGLDGVGRGINSGIGTAIGTGAGLLGLGIQGAEAMGTGIMDAAALGTGVASEMGRGLVNGLGSGLGLAGIGSSGGRSEFGSGANGADREAMYDRGSSGFHNRGVDNNRVTKITTSEQNHSHDVGSHNNYADGADRGADFGRYDHGMSDYEQNRGVL